MSIKFECEQCRKEIKAPDTTAGKRGKCPFCGHPNFVPAAPEVEEIPLAPIDQAEEEHMKHEIEELRARERALLTDGEIEPAVPLEHKEELSAPDLHHLVINYCLDMAASKLERAQVHAGKLKEFGTAGKKAAEDFATGQVLDPALANIPERVLNGFLKQLLAELK